MNKLTKYACILTALAGAVACSDGKKALRYYPASARGGDTR
jgi:hexosaminidase